MIEILHVMLDNKEKNAPIVQEDRVEPQAPEAQPILRRSTRAYRPLDRYVPSLDYFMLTDCEEPSCYEEAMLKDEKLKWEKIGRAHV